MMTKSPGHSIMSARLRVCGIILVTAPLWCLIAALVIGG